MKTAPRFGMLFYFSNEIERRHAAQILRLRRRHQQALLRCEPGAYYFDGFILHTR
jgi:hypothetical protein